MNTCTYVVLFVLFPLLVTSDYEYYINRAAKEGSKKLVWCKTPYLEEIMRMCDSWGDECIALDTHGWLYSNVTGWELSDESSIAIKRPKSAYVLENPSILRLWPLPRKISSGSSTVNIGYPFHFSASTKSEILNQAFKRYQNIIFTRKPEKQDLANSIRELQVVVDTDDETLDIETSERYTLGISTSTAILKADTIYGALRGLQTFSQLVHPQFNNEADLEYVIYGVPMKIEDYPEFKHRGIMIETSGFYYPVSTIKMIIEAMSYAKLNALHWHFTDASNFPLQSKIYPKIWEASWSQEERYTYQDVQEIVEYGKQYGIRIIPEIDAPGHAWSWGVGYPDVRPEGYESAKGCPNTDCPGYCNVPLDPSSQLARTIFSSVVQEYMNSNGFIDSLFHLGGDEARYACWENSNRIANYMKEKNFTNYDELFLDFIKVGYDTVSRMKRTPVYWDDVWRIANRLPSKDGAISKLLNGSIFQAYMNDTILFSAIINSGYRAIRSNWNNWYINNQYLSWQDVYHNNMYTNIDEDKKHLVMGGEVCLWSGDASNVHEQLWPRAAALSERLWNYSGEKSSDPGITDLSIYKRIAHFRGELVSRGIPSSPVTKNVASNVASLYKD